MSAKQSYLKFVPPPKLCKSCGQRTQGGADLCYICSNNALAAMHIFAPTKPARASV